MRVLIYLPFDFACSSSYVEPTFTNRVTKRNIFLTELDFLKKSFMIHVLILKLKIFVMVSVYKIKTKLKQ